MKITYTEQQVEPLIGSNEAAEFLGFSAMTIRRMAHDGRLPSIAFPTKDGKFRHRYRLSELQNYLNTLQRRPVVMDTDISAREKMTSPICA